jgi:hypothetical protein
MAHDVYFTQIWEVQIVTHKAFIERVRINVAARQGKPTPSRFSFFPEQWLVQYKACCT